MSACDSNRLLISERPRFGEPKKVVHDALRRLRRASVSPKGQLSGDEGQITDHSEVRFHRPSWNVARWAASPFGLLKLLLFQLQIGQSVFLGLESDC